MVRNLGETVKIEKKFKENIFTNLQFTLQALLVDINDVIHCIITVAILWNSVSKFSAIESIMEGEAQSVLPHISLEKVNRMKSPTIGRRRWPIS